MKSRWIEPITLTGSKVVLEPLALEHADGVREAVKDGDGVYRDTVVFSIINLEWPAIKQSLQFKLSGHYE